MFSPFKASLRNVTRFGRILFLLVVVSCSGPDDAGGGTDYFNAVNYFSAEAARLTAQHPTVLKMATWNGHTDSATVTISDWHKELEPFSQSSIHRPSFRNSYRVDTTASDGSIRITYTALESRLSVRFMEVQSGRNGVERITVLSGDTNMVVGLRRELTYVADSGYIIHGWQAMKLTKTAEYTIRVEWK